MNRTPFDTQRLDEECERIAEEASNASRALILPEDVRKCVNGTSTMDKYFVEVVMNLCRRPKTIPEVAGG